jgi:hypothetical protein
VSGLHDALKAFGFASSAAADSAASDAGLTDEGRLGRFVPVVPVEFSATGTLKAAPLLAVPVVPVVPVEKTKVESDVCLSGGVLGVSLRETPSAQTGMQSVQCGTCGRYLVDQVNPMAGMGACGLGLAYRRGEVLRYPMAWRECAQWRERGSLESVRDTGSGAAFVL